MSDPTEGENPEIEQASAVDEGQRKRKETKIQRREREDREFFRLVVASEAGRRFLWSILTECHAFETRFAFGPVGVPDPHETFFRLGEQLLGQRLYQSWLVKAPEPVISMMRENDPRFSSLVA